MDIDSGRVLYQKNMNEKRLIASTTKIMTFLIAIENGKLEDIYKVGDEVLSMYGTNIYLEVGEEMKLKDLLYGLILRSGNDSSVVIPTDEQGNGGYLYIAPGYYGATQISLGTLIPDNPSDDAVSANILSGYEAFTTDGKRLVGSIGTYDGTYTTL